jgi:hypothetical protein
MSKKFFNKKNLDSYLRIPYTFCSFLRNLKRGCVYGYFTCKTQ